MPSGDPLTYDEIDRFIRVFGPEGAELIFKADVRIDIPKGSDVLKPVALKMKKNPNYGRTMLYIPHGDDMVLLLFATDPGCGRQRINRFFGVDLADEVKAAATHCQFEAGE
jgi:hypothetical protein